MELIIFIIPVQEMQNCDIFMAEKQNGRRTKVKFVQFGPKIISVIFRPYVTPIQMAIKIIQNFRKTKHPNVAPNLPCTDLLLWVREDCPWEYQNTVHISVLEMRNMFYCIHIP